MRSVTHDGFLGLSLGIVLCGAVAGSVQGDVIHVPTKEAPTIQAGIELAVDDDTVLVAPGTYNEAIDFLGKRIVVESSDGAEVTIIDATGLDTSVVTVASGEAVGTELRGFTITGGAGTVFSEAALDDDDRAAGSQLQLVMQLVDGSTTTHTETAMGVGESRGGGGIVVMNSALLIEHCIITNNHVSQAGGLSGGGGFLVTEPQGVVVRHCVIESNSAQLGGGGLVSFGSMQVMDSTFRDNAADQGGGFNVNSSAHVVMANTVLEENTAGSVELNIAVGGGVAVMPNSGASFLFSEFRHNTSAREGGGLSTSGPNTTVNQCVFEQNTAMRGGGVSSSGMLTVLSSQFIDNAAVGEEGTIAGGGLYVEDMFASASTTLSNSSFVGNSVSGAALNDIDAGGGGARLARAVTMTNCTFENNTSNTFGGGVRTVISTVAEQHIEVCTFENNHADNMGGGMLATTKGSFASAKINVSNCHFVSNSAGFHGGGFARSGLDGGSVVSHCTFDNNTTTSGGGMALHVGHDGSQNNRMKVMNCQFTGNSADLESGGGGAVSVGPSGGSGSVAQVDFEQCTFENNTAWLGGAAVLYFTGTQQQWQPSRFIECHFESNHAMEGGAVNVNNGGAAGIVDSTFIANTADSYGGAVLAMSSATLHIEVSHFSGNQANWGGAAALFTQILFDNAIESCTFEANTALADGGAIYSTRSYPASNCHFYDNTAGERGGAIAATESASPLLQGGTLIGNSASQEGGAIYSDSAQGAKLQDMLVCNNSPDNIAGPFQDLGGNTIVDVCPPEPTPGDLNDDGVVDVADLLILLGAWGPCPDGNNCPADLNADGDVDATDLLLLLGNWG